MGRRLKRSARRDQQFFETLEKTGAPAAAARVAGYARSNVYRWRTAEPAFGSRWDEALALYVEGLEHALDQRGFDGTQEPVIYQGKVQYERNEDGVLRLDEAGIPIPLMVRKFDTRAAMFRLQHLRPERYTGKTRAARSDDAGGDGHIGEIFDFESIRTGRQISSGGSADPISDDIVTSRGCMNGRDEPRSCAADDREERSNTGHG